ncbi:MAG: hypothetical protein ABI456_16485 [Ktedonobacteraceae bacterium]
MLKGHSLKLVGRGVDTLVLNVCHANSSGYPVKEELDIALQDELERLQADAREDEAPRQTRWAFQGFTLFMQERGSRGPWKWILRCPLLSVAVSRGRLSRVIAQVRLSSEFLWSCETVSDALTLVSLFLHGLFDSPLWMQVSAVDLCADLVGWDVGSCSWQEAFVSRAAGDSGRPASDSDLPDGPDVMRRRWKKIATLDFGKHTSPISCCIYHKTAEIAQKSPTKAWFYDLWKRNGWNELDEVWRVEFRLTREFLHSVEIEGMHELPDRLPALWSYCAGQVGGGADGFPDGWLRYVTPTEDTNRSRWPVHPAWEVVQQAFSTEDTGLGPLVRTRIREENIKRGLSSVLGYLSTLSAWVGGDLACQDVDLSLVLHWLHDAGHEHMEEKEQDFAALVERKVQLYRSEDERI